MSDLVGNPEDRFSHNEAHIVPVLGHCLSFYLGPSNVKEIGISLYCLILNAFLIKLFPFAVLDRMCDSAFWVPGYCLFLL